MPGADTQASAEILQEFVTTINHHDVSALVALMTTDHVLVDSVGNRAQGTASLELAWRSYFEMCPNYWQRPMIARSS